MPASKFVLGILLTSQAFVHISTAYSNCNRTNIDELIYPTSFGPEEVFEILKRLEGKDSSGVTNELLEGRPNTYTYAKSLAKSLIHIGTNCQSALFGLLVVCGGNKNVEKESVVCSCRP